MNRRTKLMIAKYALYVLLMVILYVLQTDPNLFAIAGVKPVLVLPFAVCIAMFDSQLAGGLFGLLRASCATPPPTCCSAFSRFCTC